MTPGRPRPTTARSRRALRARARRRPSVACSAAWSDRSLRPAVPTRPAALFSGQDGAGRRQRRIGDAVAVEMRHPRTGLPATERDPAVMLLGARSTKNAERGGLLALGGRLRMRGCRCRGDMGGIAGMFGYGRVENGARVGIALAAKLVELRHVLLEQAAL